MFHPHHMIYVPVARLDPSDRRGRPHHGHSVAEPVLDRGPGPGRLAPGRIGFPARDGPASCAALCALLAARGVMIYSVRVETYLPALACLVLATSLATNRPVRSWLLVPTVALAVLYHQTNVLFVLPLLVLLCHRRGEGGNSLAWSSAAMILIRSAALVVGIYVLGFKYESPPVGFWDFVLSYARAPIEAWGSFSYYSPAGILALATSQARMILPVPAGAAFIGGTRHAGRPGFSDGVAYRPPAQESRPPERCVCSAWFSWRPTCLFSCGGCPVMGTFSWSPCCHCGCWF